MELKLNLKIFDIKKINSNYGETLVYEMKDNENNLFTKFGEIKSRFLDDGGYEVKIGSSVSFYGVVSGHSEYKGTKKTKIGRIYQIN